ncbi:phophatidylserine decarboxylase associated domain-containing protein, partial [Clostridium perfringens]|nr:phophatidylserine decarboxylase associated domain-containing protein [Clostridium perfringens]
LLMFNEIFREAPSFGSLGPPMYMIMARVMNTEGGFSAFTKESLNLQFKKMLQTWERYLLSKDSTSVLNANPDGWFSTEAIDAMMEKYAPGRTFAQVFICNPDEDAWGFTSYEDFFVRRYREPDVDRPTGDISDLRIVGAACESAFYALQNDVQRTDELFIKDEAYSLVHLLAGDESVDSFVGGTVIQSFLNTTGYHRWHVPVNGTIKKIVDVPGTYFAQAPSLIGLETGPDELPPYLQSLQFFANTAARQ